MTVTRFFAGAIARLISRSRLHRRRRLGQQIMNDLPPHLQRDIGWDPWARQLRGEPLPPCDV